jgi:fibronectin-binding autotransporter adhesin
MLANFPTRSSCRPGRLPAAAFTSFLVASVMLGASPVARGANFTWNGGGSDNNWSTPLNWTSSVAPANDGSADATMAGSVRPSPTVDIPWSIDSLGYSSNCAAFTLGGSALTIGAGGIVNRSSNVQILNTPIVLGADQSWYCGGNSRSNVFCYGNVNNNGHVLTIVGNSGALLNGNISGSGSLVVSTTGSVDCYGSNSYSGGTVLNQGELYITAGQALGASGSPITFNGGLLYINNSASMTIASGGITLGTGGGQIRTAQPQFSTITIPGNIQGPGSLKFSGGGPESPFILSAANTFSGYSSIAYPGYLQLDNSLALQNSTFANGNTVYSELLFGTSTTTLGGLTGLGTLNLSGTVSIGNNNASTTYSGSLTGAASLIKIGSGTLTLGATNTYVGPSTVNQGSLVVNSSMLSPVTVNSGGTLGGSGYLSSVTVTPSGQIAPGNPLGTLTISGSLSLASSAVMDYELDTPLTSGLISCGTLIVTGQLEFSNFDFTWTGNFGPGTYDLIEDGSIPNGILGSSNSGTIDGYSANLAVSGNDLVLDVVPEPSTAALLATSALGLLGYGWRRRLLTRIKERSNV